MTRSNCSSVIFLSCASWHDAGVVDQRVDAAPLGHDAVDHRARCSALSVTSTLNASGLAAGLDDRIGDRACASGMLMSQTATLAPSLRELERRRLADALARAGDDRNLVRQAHGRVLSLVAYGAARAASETGRNIVEYGALHNANCRCRTGRAATVGEELIHIKNKVLRRTVVHSRRVAAGRGSAAALRHACRAQRRGTRQALRPAASARSTSCSDCAAVPLVDVGPVGGADPRRQRLGVAEQDGREALARRARSVELAVAAADDPLVDDVEHVVEHRRRRSPGPRRRRAARRRGRASSSPARERAVGFERPGELRRRQRFARDRLERVAKRAAGRPRRATARPRTRDRRSAAIRPGARLATRSSASRRWKPGDRAARTLELAAAAAREDDRRAVEAVLQPRRDDADDALVPSRVGTGRACTRRRRPPIGVERRQRLVLHRRLDRRAARG